MALSTYLQLQAAVARHLDREDSDFLSDIPDLITLCEERINNGDATGWGLRVADMETQAVLTPDADGYADLPADYLQMRAVDGGSQGNTPFTRDFYDTQSAGISRSFTIIGDRIRFARGFSGPTGIIYYAKIPALSEANPTNWLLTKAPSAYLYGTLLASAPYESDDARLQTWLALYTSAIAGLKATDVGARWSNAVARVRRATP